MARNLILGSLLTLVACGCALAQSSPGPGPIPAVPGGSSGNVQTNNGTGGFSGIATTGSGSSVLATSPTMTTPTIGAAQATSVQFTDATLGRFGANNIYQVNGVTAQKFDVMNTYTDGSDYEAGLLGWSSNVLKIGSDALGTGSARAVQFVMGGTNIFNINTSGHLLWNTDNTYDIGASGANRPRNIYAASNVFASGSTFSANVQIPITNTFRWIAGDIISNPVDGTLVFSSNNAVNSFTLTSACAPATPCVQLGAADADTNAVIVAQTLRTQGLLTGGTADQAGKNFTVIVSPGKGTGAGGSFILQTAPAGSTGTTVGTPATGFSLDSTGAITMPKLTTGTNADFVCASAGLVLLVQTSACTISSLRFKTNLLPYEGSALDAIRAMTTWTFNLKPAPNPDPNHDANQIGLIAENIAKVAPECAIYENDMKTPKSYRQECVIALLVKGEQELLAKVTAFEHQNVALRVQMRRLNHRH